MNPPNYSNLFLEIDYNLNLLQDYWDKYQDFLNKPLSVSEAMRRIAQVVIKTPLQLAEIGSLESENLPRWRHKEFDSLKLLNSMSEREQKDVRQFYFNLDSITSIYEKIKSLGLKVVHRTNIEKQLENLITETIERGNPLKGIQLLIAHGQLPDSFLLKARQEVQDIYDYIKKNSINSGGLLKSPSKLKYDKALERFQGHKKKFEILTVKDLDDIEIYNVTSHPNREIMGRILDKIVLRKNYISNGGQKLYERSQKLLRKTA